MQKSRSAPRGRLWWLLLPVTALGLTACGTATQTSTTTTAPAASSAQIPQVRASSVAGKPASVRLLREVNTVCRAVRQGAPPALRAPYTPAAVERYAFSAQAPARRTLVSLQRLSSSGDTSTLQAIARSYGQLQAVYATAPVVARSSHGARQLGTAIQAQEQFIAAAARSAGAPACGVVGR
jgi:hypothetical protein